jgi:phosphomannomutase
MVNFLFDVDGTLTPPRKSMVSDFKTYFKFWVRTQQSSGNKVYLVTGSDKDKTIKQVGKDLWLLVDGSYQNCGNQLYCKGSLVFENTWHMDEELEVVVSDLTRRSKWYGTAENNIERRIGMVNISTIGNSCTREQRLKYYQWDEENLEREAMVDTITTNFPEIDATIGGEISIDIYPKGNDKSQVLEHLDGKNIFFGDKCYAGGNDYTISEAAYEKYHVADWTQTRDILAVIDKIREIEPEENEE